MAGVTTFPAIASLFWGNDLGRSPILLLSARICDRAEVQAGAQRQRVS
ncbi:MAG: hypothetical protein GDA56_28205 [Hormoscilla sp. GM7CHS1pb]|nr:hypothetical protein [Hormoscilla sp. GM7CHS1pb]